jgi:streptogramin lyase
MPVNFGGRVCPRALLGSVVASLLFNMVAASAGGASSAPAPAYTPYSQTGVVNPYGLAAAGNFVWIADIGNDGHGAKVVRLDAQTGATQVVRGSSLTFPTKVVASPRYAWVMDQKLRTQTWSLVRINASNLTVRHIAIPGAGSAGIGYLGGPILLAGDSVWIPGARGLLRVNTTTLRASEISSPLILGAQLSVVADRQFLWMNASYAHVNQPNGPAPSFFVRVSLRTGAVTKVSFPGVKGGFPIGDDGTNLWIENASGMVRLDPAAGRFVSFAVPSDAQIVLQSTGPSAVAAGDLYLTAGLTAQQRLAVVSFNIASGAATVLRSPLLYRPTFAASADGVLWIANQTELSAKGLPKQQPVLVRITRSAGH